MDHSILIWKLECHEIRVIVSDWCFIHGASPVCFIWELFLNPTVYYLCCSSGVCPWPLLFFLYINDFCNCSSQLDFSLFADDSNLLCTDKSLPILESNGLQTWSCFAEMGCKAGYFCHLVYMKSEMVINRLKCWWSGASCIKLLITI